jgi:hypothetical protein
MKIKALFIVLLISAPLFAEQSVFPSPALQKVKTAPKKYIEAADVVTEWAEASDPCDIDKICVEGVLYNQGHTTASNVKLRVEIGGSKYAKPRITLTRTLDEPTMEPGDRQEFNITIDRKIPYKDKGEDKEIEVGKYNFKLVPIWLGKDTTTKPKPSRKK